MIKKKKKKGNLEKKEERTQQKCNIFSFYSWFSKIMYDDGSKYFDTT